MTQAPGLGEGGRVGVFLRRGGHPTLRPRATSPPPLPRRAVCVPRRKYCPRWKTGIEGYSRLTNRCLPLLSSEKEKTLKHSIPGVGVGVGGVGGSSGPRGRTSAPRVPPSRRALSSLDPRPPPGIFSSTAQCPFTLPSLAVITSPLEWSETLGHWELQVRRKSAPSSWRKTKAAD